MTISRLFATVLATALAVCSLTSCMAALGPASDVTEVSVLVLNFDPQLEGRRVSDIGEDRGWAPARALADSLRSAMWERSFRKMLIDFVDWRDLAAFPAMVSGAPYDMAAYQRCLEDEAACRVGPVDLPAILDRYGAAAMVDRHIADEVWIFGGPHMGLEGAAMVGSSAIEIDAAYPRAGGERPFAVMGFNVAAGMTDVLHTYCRRIEATVAHALRQTPAGRAEWARFSATAADADTVGVGTCDHAPNAHVAGDYAAPDTVVSTAPQWLSYPVAPGATQPVSAATWSGPDYRRNFLRWWFFHLPHGRRASETGVPGNWWPLAY